MDEWRQRHQTKEEGLHPIYRLLHGYVRRGAECGTCGSSLPSVRYVLFRVMWCFAMDAYWITFKIFNWRRRSTKPKSLSSRLNPLSSYLTLSSFPPPLLSPPPSPFLSSLRPPSLNLIITTSSSCLPLSFLPVPWALETRGRRIYDARFSPARENGSGRSLLLCKCRPSEY